MMARSVIWEGVRTVVLSSLVLAAGVSGEAATVRGRLDRIANGRRNPAVGVPVTLFRAGSGRSSPAYSNQDGMYYLKNIAPGTYNLEIWTSRDPGVHPKSYVIKVSEPITDIPAIGF
jgi:Carboxypeptidase regulatory-like domain